MDRMKEEFKISQILFYFSFFGMILGYDPHKFSLGMNLPATFHCILFLNTFFTVFFFLNTHDLAQLTHSTFLMYVID